jgi:hypothetical protein
MSTLGVFVGIPEFHRGVDVENPVIMAPRNDFAAVDIPSEIDEQITLGKILTQNRANVFGSNLFLFKMDSLGCPRSKGFLVGLKIKNCDFIQRHLDVFEKYGESATGNGSEAEKNDTISEGKE